jgi:hypothetical protein
MNDAAPGTERFEFDYPTWTLVNREIHRTAGLPFSSVQVEQRGGTKILLQFTNEDLALRFIEGTGMAHCEPVKIPDAAQFISLLREMTFIGVTHVGIDCPPFGDNARPRWFVPLADAIRMLEREA